MLSVMIDSPGEPSRFLQIDELPCVIGRHSAINWNLKGWRVSRQHAQFELQNESLAVRDLGSMVGTWVNGQRVTHYGPLNEADEIQIAGHRIRVQAFMPPAGVESNGSETKGRKPAAVTDAGVPIQKNEVHLNSNAGTRKEATLNQRSAQSTAQTDLELFWRRRLQQELLTTIDFRRHDIRLLGQQALEQLVHDTLSELIGASDNFPATLNRAEIIQEVCFEAIGLGPLEHLMKDESISEIMVNGLTPIFVERRGKLEQTHRRFTNADAIRAVIDRIVAPLGRRIDEASPMVDARLPDGSRVNAVIAPLALNGPSITIRRFNRKMLDPGDLFRLGSASQEMIDFMSESVKCRLNIIVSGGTGSGKTTLLNLLSSMIGEAERVVTIEDAAELRLHHSNLVSLEARPVNAEGRGLIQIRDLVRNALRMRPDRIVVGECRGGEALDMLQAMNTGHDGSLTTVHANGPRDVISRLEVMSLMAGLDIPVQALREQIASAVDLVIHQARFPDGSRRISEISEVTGIEGSKVLMQSIFRYRAERGGRAGGFEATGHIPQFIERLDNAASGFKLSWFEERS